MVLEHRILHHFPRWRRRGVPVALTHRTKKKGNIMYKLPKMRSTITFPRIVQLLYRKPNTRIFEQVNGKIYLIRPLEKGDAVPVLEFLPGYLIQPISPETYRWLRDQQIIISTDSVPILPNGYELIGTWFGINKEDDFRTIYYFEKKARIGMVKRMGVLRDLEHYTYDHLKKQ